MTPSPKPCLDRGVEEAPEDTIRCCGCGDTIYDNGRYDCTCTEQEETQWQNN